MSKFKITIEVDGDLKKSNIEKDLKYLFGDNIGYSKIEELEVYKNKTPILSNDNLNIFLNPENYYTPIRIIEYPGDEICKDIIYRITAASNCIGSFEYLSSIDSEEDWKNEYEKLIKQLQSKEYDETFRLVTEYVRR